MPVSVVASGASDFTNLVQAGAAAISAIFAAAIYFVYRGQSRIMRAQFRAALRAANAARKSATVAERALVDVERPWIFRDIVSVSWRHTPGVEANDWIVSLKWKNVGRLPALLVDCEFKIEDITKLPAIPDYRGSNHLPVISTLAVGQDFDTMPVGPAPSRAPLAKSPQLVFFGRLIYREMNGKEHHSGFALQLAPMAAAAVEHTSDAYNYYS